MHPCWKNRGVQDMSLFWLTLSLPEVSTSPQGDLYIFLSLGPREISSVGLTRKQKWNFVGLLQPDFQYIMTIPTIFWLGIISLNTVFFKEWAKSASHLSQLWREKKERRSKFQQSWNERMYMFKAGYKPPILKVCITHTNANSAVQCTFLHAGMITAEVLHLL